MKVSAPQRVRALQRAVMRYYRRHRRDLPWRRTRDPYRILVSEIMLQQTQVERVIPKYHAFLRSFPTLASLARARLADILRAWVGLGYNGRAVRLWRCARIIVAERAGRFPHDEAALRGLPGVGKYTAAALASFAFGEHAAAVDVNVRRVLSRSLTGNDDLTAAAVTRLATAALPSGKAADWTQALMDVGARFCRPQPKCEDCPARRACKYAQCSEARFAGRRPRTAANAAGRFVGSTRYYRGRIIRILTSVPSLSMLQLGVQVKTGFGLSDRPWLHAILQALQRDGLVRLRRDARISLP